MQLQEVKAINGVLHYEHNGKWYPIRIVGNGAGGRRNPGIPGPPGPPGPSECITNVTYNGTLPSLVNLISTNGLNPGCQYRITDFRTREIIPNTTDVVVGSIEPLIVTAASTNTIHQEAISAIFPSDEIFYEVVDSTTSGGDRGRIYFRHDTIKDNLTWYDWRVVKFRRWESAPASGIFNSITDNGNAFLDFYTFDNSASASNCFGNHIGEITDGAITQLFAPPDKLNNIVLKGWCQRNTFDTDCFNSTLGDTIGASQNIMDNAIGSLFVNNIIGDAVRYNTISIQFANNFAGTGFSYNLIGKDTRDNNFGNGFLSNITGNQFVSNYFEAGFQYNVVGASFIGNSFTGAGNDNVIGDAFSSNTILGAFFRNTFDINCDGNTFGSGSYHDCKHGTLFQSNIIQNGSSTIFGYQCQYNTYTSIGGCVIESGFISNSGNDINGNYLGTAFQSNQTGINFSRNRVGSGFNGNIIVGYFANNDIGDDCASNNVNGANFVFNRIGVAFVNNNPIGNDFKNNDIGNNFSGNQIGDTFQDNKIGNRFGNNILGTGFISNSIMDVFSNNFIGIDFNNNIIQNDFNGNTIADTFNNNTIRNKFMGNTSILSSFQKNCIESDFPSATDFGLATHTYANYTFEIKLTSDSATYLGFYYNNAGALLFAVPNA